nr:hypothetical protein [uncultured Kingella sp.]
MFSSETPLRYAGCLGRGISSILRQPENGFSIVAQTITRGICRIRL